MVGHRVAFHKFAIYCVCHGRFSNLQNFAVPLSTALVSRPANKMTCTRLLIIDETRESEEQISALLSQEKYQVEFLAEIEAALERIRRTPCPDVLLFNFQRI